MIIKTYEKALEKLEKIKEDFISYKVEITKKTKRSLNQNALLWLWMTCLENETETGYEKYDYYDYFIEKYAPQKIVFGKQIKVTSSKMNTEQMTKFLNSIQIDCASSEYYKCHLPLPEQQGFDEFINKYYYGS